MVFFLTGVPGSGKTYYLVDYAEKNINKVDKTTNEKIYLQVVHNISGYKNGYYVDFGTDYLPKIVELNQYFLSVKKNIDKDDLLKKKAEDLGLYKILLIVDECHLYFVNDFTDKGKKQYYALLWFISYHRHIFVDLVLATQNLSLVDYKFKAFAEYYVKAVPSSMRLNFLPFVTPKFTYHYYPDSKMWRDSRFRTEKIKADKRIFDLYTSGDTVKKQKVYFQTLLLIAFFVVLTILLWLLFKHTFTRTIPDHSSPSTPVVIKNSTPPSPVSYHHKKREDFKSAFQNEDIQFDVVTCSDNSGFCTSDLLNLRIHSVIFKNLLSLKLLEPFYKFSQYGITKYYIILHLSKRSYQNKFFYDPPSERKPSKSHSLDVGLSDITDRYKEYLDKSQKKDNNE